MEVSADILQWIRRRVPGRMWLCLGTGILSGFVTHLFMITNKIPNWDDLTVIPTMGLGPYGGRWLGDAVQKFFSKWSAPGVNGVWAVLLVALTACLAADIVRIRSWTGIVFCAVLFQTFPVMASNMTFMFMTETFATAAFLMCLAVELMLRFRWGWIPAVLLQMWSMACYQAYYPLGVGLTVLALLRKTVEEARTGEREGNRLPQNKGHQVQGMEKKTSRAWWRRFLQNHGWDSVGAVKTSFYCLFTLAAGMVAYLISFRVTTRNLTDFDLVQYRGIENIGNESGTEYLHAFLRAYHRVLQFYLTEPLSYTEGTILTYHRILTVAIVVLWLLALLLYRLWEKPVRLILYCFLTALLPLSMGLVYVMSPETQDASTNMIPAYVVFYLVLIVLMELTIEALAICRQSKSGCGEKAKKSALAAARVISVFCAVMLALISYAYYKVDNTAYYRSYIANERVKAMYNRIYARLEEQDGYTYDSRVLIAGDWWPEPNVLSSFDMDGSLYTDLDGLANEHGLMTSGVRQSYVRLFLGINAATVDPLEEEAIENSKEYQAMPVYPAEGCIRKFDDIYVVKLAE